MGTEQHDHLWLSDAAGNVYVFPPDVLAQHRIPDAEKDALVAALDDDVDDVRGHFLVLENDPRVTNPRA